VLDLVGIITRLQTQYLGFRLQFFSKIRGLYPTTPGEGMTQYGHDYRICC
jgi:hypothetical protein